MSANAIGFAPQGIIFDFDGVIVESVDIKTEAFRALFAHERAHVDSIVQFHETHGGLSRFDKFDVIYRDILRRPLGDEERVRLGTLFSELVVEAVVACP